MKPTNGSLPKYLQVTELLVRDIAAGRLIDGERLPPERDMAAEMDIAVGTLRKSLAELQTRGLLSRVQGSGNYVQAISDPKSIYAMFRLELIGGGGLPTAQVLSVDRVTKDPSLPDFGRTDDAHRIRRLRRLGGHLAAVEEIWLDGSYAASLTADDLLESLYHTYRAKLGLWITRAEDQVGQSALPAWSPAVFPYAPGAPLPDITRVSWDQNGDRAEVSRTWFDPNVARYVARLK